MYGTLLLAAVMTMAASGVRAADANLSVTAGRGDSLAARAARLVEERLRADHPELTRIDVQPVAPSADGASAASHGGLVPVLARQDLLAKRVVVHFESRADRIVRRIPVWLAVSAYRPVLTTQRALRPGERVGTPDVGLRETDVTVLDGELLDSTEGLAGLRVRRYLPANTAVRRGDLEPAPPVVREQDVAVRIAVGRVAVETRGVAQQDGRTGELIKIRNPGSAKVYMAKVAGPGTVEIVRR